jgi:hypothetical protein
MPRGLVNKPPMQFVEILAMFRAGEAAADAVQKNTKANRAEVAKEEYKAWLERLACDPGLVAEGLGWVAKKRPDGAVWSIDLSVECRSEDLLKKHKELLTQCRRSVMPAYFSFYTKLGKPPSGSADIADAIEHVRSECWKEAEDMRIASQMKAKPAQVGPIVNVEEEGSELTPAVEAEHVAGDCTAGEDAGGDVVVDVVADDGVAKEVKRGPPKLPSTARSMPVNWSGTNAFMVWLRAGPLAPSDDISHSLTGPGEVTGKQQKESCRAFQRAQQKRKQATPDPDQILIDGDSPVISGESSKGQTNHNSLVQLSEVWVGVEKLRADMNASKRIEHLKLLLELSEPGEDQQKVKAELVGLLKAKLHSNALTNI